MGQPLKVVVDECVGSKSRLFQQFRAWLEDRPVEFLYLAERHPGIPDVEILDKLLGPTPQPYPVVIMAGGEGTRLRPQTEHTPKPMLDVGGKPILETIIRRCAAAGFSDFHISVNYRADVIKHHFGDGRSLGVDRPTPLQKPPDDAVDSCC